jgi:periplasmic divalent cation tolerance protein
MNDFSIVMTTCSGAAETQPIIDVLLQRRLAACIQTMPIQSHYIWNNAVHHEGEILLFIKCKTENYDDVEETILRLHSYELPEIIRVPIEGGLDRYLAWMAGTE